jgi:hypothetical protein
VSSNPDDEYISADVHDRVSNCIFGAGLTLASVLSLQRLDDEVAGRLHDAIDALDTAARELRSAALARVVRSRDAGPETPHRAVPNDWRRRLCRVSVNEVFAYAIRGYDFYCASDHMLWAHESDGVLLSARSGTPFARRVGNLFHDIESNVPLYYEEEHAETLPTSSSEASS